MPIVEILLRDAKRAVVRTGITRGTHQVYNEWSFTLTWYISTEMPLHLPLNVKVKLIN
jgi:hypothetical protein